MSVRIADFRFAEPVARAFCPRCGCDAHIGRCAGLYVVPVQRPDGPERIVFFVSGRSCGKRDALERELQASGCILVHPQGIQRVGEGESGPRPERIVSFHQLLVEENDPC